MNEYPEERAEHKWEQTVLLPADMSICNIVCSLVKHSEMGHWCGYVRLPRKLKVDCRYSGEIAGISSENYYHGLVQAVPVHGGITYSKVNEDGTIVYGFDCNHISSPKDPSLEWLKLEIMKMLWGLILCEALEAHEESTTSKYETLLSSMGGTLSDFAESNPIGLFCMMGKAAQKEELNNDSNSET